MSTIAFLGAGNIANAIMGGLISDGHSLFAFDPIEHCRERARGQGVTIASSNTDAISKADIVMSNLMSFLICSMRLHLQARGNCLSASLPVSPPLAC